MSSYKYKKSVSSNKKRLSLNALAIAALFGASGMLKAEEPTVIELTQTPCQFLEAENGVDHGYTSASADDCKAINAKNAKERLSQAPPLKLKAGKHIFRVTNKNVSYDLGFWLRGSGLLGKVKLPSISGGGLTTGVTKDYEIELTAGEYLFSCPLNPTPDYHVIVE